MTERQIIKEIKRLCDMYGAITVAMSLGYRDPRTPKRWIEIKKFPKHKRLAIEQMIAKYERQGDDY